MTPNKTSEQKSNKKNKTIKQLRAGIVSVRTNILFQILKILEGRQAIDKANNNIGILYKEVKAKNA
jgi:hypothetical protein